MFKYKRYTYNFLAINGIISELQLIPLQMTEMYRIDVWILCSIPPCNCTCNCWPVWYYCICFQVRASSLSWTIPL